MNVNKNEQSYVSLSGKNLIFKSFDWLYYNGHLTAMRPVAILLTMMLIYGDRVSIQSLGIAYLITLIVYSYDRVRGLDEDRVTNAQRSEHLSRKRKYYPYLLSLYLVALAVIVLLYATAELIVLAMSAMVLVTIGIFYTTSLKSVTKHIPAFKTILIASEWATTIVLLYGIFYHSFTSIFTLMFGVFIFFKLFISSVFFDIKDTESDRQQGLKTIPVLIGYKNTLNLLKLLLIISLLPIVIGVFIFSQPKLTLLLLPFDIIFYMIIRVAESNEGKPLKYYIPAHLEYMLWPLGIMIGTIVIKVL